MLFFNLVSTAVLVASTIQAAPLPQEQWRELRSLDARVLGELATLPESGLSVVPPLPQELRSELSSLDARVLGGLATLLKSRVSVVPLVWTGTDA